MYTALHDTIEVRYLTTAYHRWFLSRETLWSMLFGVFSRSRCVFWCQRRCVQALTKLPVSTNGPPLCYDIISIISYTHAILMRSISNLLLSHQSCGKLWKCNSKRSWLSYIYTGRCRFVGGNENRATMKCRLQSFEGSTNSRLSPLMRLIYLRRMCACITTVKYIVAESINQSNPSEFERAKFVVHFETLDIDELFESSEYRVNMVDVVGGLC